MNTYLYKAFHSYHHRLYVPYAFGALYNHPLEGTTASCFIVHQPIIFLGFLFDSLGAVAAEMVSGMTTRQAALLFGVSALKTVRSLPTSILPHP